MIYDPGQPIRKVVQVVELRSTTQVSQFAMFFYWLSYIYDPAQPIRDIFLVVELRSTTEHNQFAMF